MSQHWITRKIEIDAGHRIPDHRSKCKNVHGHRYVIEATCSGELFTEGEQQGMVLDFGFLKEEMVREIDDPCDHGMILYRKDPLVARIKNSRASYDTMMSAFDNQRIGWYPTITVLGKTYFIDSVPTAENLAAHWFVRMNGAVKRRSQQQATLERIKVFETPNCWAVVDKDSLT